MAGFDTSNVAAQVNQTSSNPFQILGGLADLQNSLNQNKMFQAKTRGGQYLAQFTDENGKTDFNGLRGALQNDKVTNPFIPELMADAQNITGQGITNLTNQQTYKQNQVTSLQKLLAQTTSDAEVPNVINHARAAGLIDDATAAGIAGGNVPGLDSQSIAALRNQSVLGQGTVPELKANIGENDFINVGGKIQPVLTKTSPNGSSVSAVDGNADLTTTLTPGQAATPVDFIDPSTNTAGTVPLGAIRTPEGGGKALPGVSNAAGVVQTGLAPGQSQYQTSTAQTLADQQNALANSVSTSAPRVTILNEMKAAHEAFRAGPGSAGWSDAVAEVNRLTGANFSTSTPSQQVFNKLATVYATQLKPALGLMPTDEQQQIAQASNPNTNLSDEAINQLIAQGLGNEDRWQAMDKSWKTIQGKIHANGTVPTAQDFGNWQSEFNSNVNPMAFQEKYMTDSQRQQMIKAMKPAELAEYNRQKARATAAGILH